MLYSFKNSKWLAVFGLLIATFLFINTAIAEVSVVVHPDNTSSFDNNDIKKLFLGKNKSFSNGRIAILIGPNQSDPTRAVFNDKVLNKSSNQVNAYWSKMMFTGKGVPPQEMSSASEIISAIADNKDAISYIDSSAVTSAVKVVATF
ncbi:MAG: ABC-type phosphate transport system substrate-binding protein [Alteromonadaceae bacterium]|jgi:ABC-type phosphate transport system substrate-binding protein